MAVAPNKSSSHAKEQATRKVKCHSSEVMNPSLTLGLGRNVEEVKTSEQAKAKKATVATSESSCQVAQTSTSKDVRKTMAEEIQRALEEMKSKPVGSLSDLRKFS